MTAPSSAVERAARALCVEAGDDPDARFDDGQPYWRQFVSPARAVLLSLRDPMDEMLKAGVRQWQGAQAGADNLGDWRCFWQGVLDAALRE